ncbi:MAG: RNA polymerase sigma factor [Isosphaeraceae bacterium]
MDETPSTRASLLVRLSDPRDERVWSVFVDICTPMVYRLARRRGLQDADAIDLTQEVFRAVASAIDRFDPDPARGTFRAWLSRIARNLAINALAARDRQVRGTGNTAVVRLIDELPATPASRGSGSSPWRRARRESRRRPRSSRRSHRRMPVRNGPMNSYNPCSRARGLAIARPCRRFDGGTESRLTRHPQKTAARSTPASRPPAHR